jgi:hypothetical protein
MRFKWFEKLTANTLGYFWLPCPECGENFSGLDCSELSQAHVPTDKPGIFRVVCKWCGPKVHQRNLEEVNARAHNE